MCVLLFMLETSIIYTFFALLFSFVIAYYFYGFRSKLNKKLRWTFGILRFLSIFILLLLFINPKITSINYNTIKPTLVLAIDNSQSINYLEQNKNALLFFNTLQESERLNNRFQIDSYRFGRDVQQLDSLDFSELQTNISKALQSIDEVYRNAIAPVVLISDGNQTVGTDYQFLAKQLEQSLFPVVLGDSITYTDLYLSQLNVNRYAYLKNEFPVEVFVGYTGTDTVNTEFSILQGSGVVYKETLQFSAEENSKIIQFTLPANRVGVNQYTARIQPLTDEKNIDNNQKRFAIEVIDQATTILLVSDIIHPDLGAIKKAISSNEQRKVIFASPEEALKHIEDAQLLILYQPNSKFQQIITQSQNAKLNTLVFTGLQTDWNFLNRVQNQFSKNTFSQENVQAVLNDNYGVFSVDDIGFSGFPPLATLLGTLQIKQSHDVLLHQYINAIDTQTPVAATFETDGVKTGIIDGEGVWRWRANSYLKEKDFESFDNFFAGIIQYLSSNKQRKRLEVVSESFYYNNNDIKITAQFFDKNYVFNNRVSLTITVKNKETNAVSTFPLLLKNNYYEVNLSSLPAGDYTYTVHVAEENATASGEFNIIEFDVEQQFINADVGKMRHIAANGKVYFTHQAEHLIDDLLANENFTSVQKSEQKTVPLVDWRYLLFLLILLLAIEWFYRKYNGLV